MLQINNNNKFVDFDNNFWAGVDEQALRSFAQSVMRASLTSFKIKFDVLLSAKKAQAQQICEEFITFCRVRGIDLQEEFKEKVKTTFKNSKNNAINIKFNLTKWKNRYRRKQVRSLEQEL